MTESARIYTRLGDDGTTGMLFGGRVAKTGDLMEAVGVIDEAVSALGVARAAIEGRDPRMQELLLMVQRHLFVVAADIACNPSARSRLEAGVSLVTAEMVAELEGNIDVMVATHPLTPRFVVPGSNPESAALDVGRTVIRRAERRVLALEGTQHDPSREVRVFLNRVSDLLYVLARTAAEAHAEALSHS